jgi:acyl dehydratase
MAIDYPAILRLEEKGRRFVYTDRDTMLYALAIGLGSDPLNEAELPFVYEKGLRAVPTLATVVAWGAGVSTDRLGVNYSLVLHGEEEVIFHRPMPPAAAIISDSGVAEVYDKGKEKGAAILRCTVLHDEADGEPIVTINRLILARGDGGCGGASHRTPEPHVVPNRPPDRSLEIKTRADQAALYRLCGDRNSLHIDPAAASKAGFKAPILHGLCSYGIACRAVLQVFCDYDTSRVASHAVRFSSPVYPGEALRFDLWRDADVISFEATVVGRDVKVLKNGKTVLRPTAQQQA